MKYSIFPPIGIARLGNSSEAFIGPERLGSAGTELTAGAPEVDRFKDTAFRFRKQACRFHLVESNDDGTNPQIFVPGPGTTVKWSVRLVNKKDAVVRPPMPPSSPVLPVANPARSNRLIDTGAQTVTGASAARQTLQGTYLTKQVLLGEAWTDESQRLLVTGGVGDSDSPENVPLANEGLDSPRPDSFYNNPGWHDDVSDGTIGAEITFGDDSTISANSAWLVVGPPDPARSGLPVTSLYDVIRQVAIDQTWINGDTTTSFTKDIYPLLANARSLRWTHVDESTINSGGPLSPQPNWASLSDDYAALSSPGTNSAQVALRRDEVGKLIKIQGLLRQYRMRQFQLTHLDRWVAGNFTSDWLGLPPIQTDITPQGLLHSALGQCAGQGFFPGIEGGRIVTMPSIYSQPFNFRFDPAVLRQGDITALMALPWQADFLECVYDWWPSQRPDLAPQSNGTYEWWNRPFTDIETDHRNMVENVMKLGVIRTVQSPSGGESAVEEGRDPSL